MKILIVSDTHGSFYELKHVIAAEQPIDVLIHCGDICGDLSAAIGRPAYHIHAVAGNCDFPGRFPGEEIFALGDHRVLLVHGHRHGVRRNNDLLVRAAKDNSCDVVFYGHTHVPESISTDGIYICNPGSLTRPRTEDGRPSYAVMTIDDHTGETSCLLRDPDDLPQGF